MARLILAAVSPDNTPHGYNWTFVYPMLLFIVIAGVLYYLFGRPHRRVPPRLISAPAAVGRPDPTTARAASVVGGVSVVDGAGMAGGGQAAAGEAPAGEAPAGASAAGETDGGDATAEHTGAQE